MRFRPSSWRAPAFGLLSVMASASFTSLALAATGNGAEVATSRLAGPLDETKVVALAKSIHPLAAARYDRGPVTDSLPMEHLFLQLRRSPQQEEALKNRIEAMQDPHSPSYHKWLTAEEIGTKYGPSRQDIDAVSNWLGAHGLQVNLVHKNGLTIDLSGTAGQVAETFHTEIHQFDVRGERHIANVSDPKIPEALAPLISGVVSLNDFRPKSLLKRPKPSETLPLDGGYVFPLGPADVATIYNVGPLYKAAKPITGKGQTVVVLERTDINSSDVKSFRTAFGLAKYSGTFAQIHPGTGCADPGKNGDEGEAALDAEWAGALAPDATVNLASCADSTTNPGYFTAAQNLIDSPKPPPILSLSYLTCEAYLGPAGNSYVSDLWQQAAAEGVSVYVSAGDGGPAGCDDFDVDPYAAYGIAANGYASTPYNVATGGTDFYDAASNTLGNYWNVTNGPYHSSAKSYIPEIPWNDSCASSVQFIYLGFPDEVTSCNSETGSSYYLDIVAGSGAPSFFYAKPSWQANIAGVPNDGVRDLPDVSLFASNGIWSHSLLFCMTDTNEGGSPCLYTNVNDVFENSAGGTSFTAPQLASVQALINQKAGGPQGNPDPIYYSLAKSEYGTNAAPNKAGTSACNSLNGTSSSSSCVFHDVTFGNIDVPCYGTVNCYQPSPGGYGALSTTDNPFHVAYPAQPGWDFATGLGTLNVTNLVKSWP